MATGRYYFLFNKKLDFLRGTSKDLAFTEEGFTLKEGCSTGWFFSRVLDAGETEMAWHRFRLTLPESGGGFFSVCIYASDRNDLDREGERIPLEDFLRSTKETLEEKKEALSPFLGKTVTLSDDVLLHEVKGRYLWFCLEMERRDGENVCIRNLRIDFPKQSWIQYLPEIYQREEASRVFLERYLGIFQSLYEDMTEKIESAAGWFDPDSAPAGMLSWLADWIALEDAPIWNENQLRFLLRHAMQLYRIRGTAEYLQKMIRLYTGCEACIVENHQLGCFRNNRGMYERLKRLYGDHPYMLTIVVHTKQKNTQKDQHTLMKIVEHAVPAYMEYQIIQLQQYIFLDQYSYLGMNSCLGQYRPFALDGQSAVHFARIERKGEGGEQPYEEFKILSV